MEKIVLWLKKNKLLAGLIALFSFAIPLIIVHVLFKFNSGIRWLGAEWSAGDVLVYIAGFLAFLGTVSLGAVALWQNRKIHEQHMESLAPALSMNLTSLNSVLYLTIENTGQSEAHDVEVSVEWIENNGEKHRLELDDLFSSNFELYPNEAVQGRVIGSGENIATQIFPMVNVTVSYRCPRLNNRQETYVRRVIYDNGYTKKVVADVNVDNRRMESDVDAIARSVVRMANYLEGRHLAKFDMLDVQPKSSLRNDMVEAIRTKEEVPILDRAKTLEEHLGVINTVEEKQENPT
jgi:hypothetical protein